MKTEVYSWRLSADKKAELEGEARREKASVSALLEEVTTDWLNARRGQGDDGAEEAAIRKRAAAAIAAIRGGDPTRASRERISSRNDFPQACEGIVTTRGTKLV